MDQERFISMDQYIEALFVPHAAALEEALKATKDAGMPEISVSPSQGKLLYLLARLARARTVLEIGTLGGYSTIWLGCALREGGRLVTIEANPRHAEVARANIIRAGLVADVEVREGRALDVLPQLQAAGVGPFDMVFIDADKPTYPDYLEWALRLTRSGSLIVADNVVRQGAVLDVPSNDEVLLGIRRFNEALAADPRVEATIVQMVGIKGYDGMAIAVVR